MSHFYLVLLKEDNGFVIIAVAPHSEDKVEKSPVSTVCCLSATIS